MSSNKILLELFKETSFDNSTHLGLVLEKLTEKTCTFLNTDRASVWLYNENKSKILCHSLSVKEGDSDTTIDRQFGAGMAMDSDSFPEYFRAMDSQRSIEAVDAHKHPAFQAMTSTYLDPLNIKSIYDAPIWLMNKVIGVVCLEYKDPKSDWDANERMLINGIADLAAKIVEHYNVLVLVEKLESQNKNLENTLRERTKVLHDAHTLLFRQEKLASLGKLSAALSHELKNPLHLILNASTILKDVCKNPDKSQMDSKEIKEYLQMISDNCYRATKIIDSILAQSKNERDHQAPINEVVADSVQMMWNASQEDNHELTYPDCRLAPEVIKHVPKMEFQRVLINVLENSMRSLRKKISNTQSANFKPQLKIQTHVLDDHILLQIRDNGIGVARENLDKIFDPFFTTDEKIGVGLGLFIVNELVRSMDGSIQVDSVKDEYFDLKISLPL